MERKVLGYQTNMSALLRPPELPHVVPAAVVPAAATFGPDDESPNISPRHLDVGRPTIPGTVLRPRTGSRNMQPVWLLGGPFASERSAATPPPRWWPIVRYDHRDRPISITNVAGAVLQLQRGRPYVVVDKELWSVAMLEQWASQKRARIAMETFQPPLFEDEEPESPAPGPVWPIDVLRPVYVDANGRRMPTGHSDDFWPVVMEGSTPRIWNDDHRDMRDGRAVILVAADNNRPAAVLGMDPAFIPVNPDKKYVTINKHVFAIDHLCDPLWHRYYLYSHPFVVQVIRQPRVGPGIAAYQGDFRPRPGRS